MPGRLENLLQPGETVDFRAKPAWRAVFLLLAAGLGFVGSMHLAIGLYDDNWYCPASLLWLALLTPFGAVMLCVTAKTEALITNRRILFTTGYLSDPSELSDVADKLASSAREFAEIRARAADGPAGDVEELARSDIEQVHLTEHKIPIAGVRLVTRNGQELTLDLLHDPKRVHDVLLGEDTIPLEQRESVGGATLVVLGATCATFAAFMTFFGVFSLSSPLLVGGMDSLDKLVRIAVAVPVGFFIAAPGSAIASLGAFLGYLPVLILSRLFVPFEEAKLMALFLRKLTPKMSWRGDGQLLERWFALWLQPVGRACSWFAEKLVGWLFGEPIQSSGVPLADERSSGGIRTI